MKNLPKPSPALAVAFVALVAALSGSAIALPGKNKVDKNDIKKNAVTSKQLKNNGVKGADVAEGTLGKVPAAGRADSAATADTLGGQGAAAFQSSSVEPLHPVGSAGSAFGPGWSTGEDDQPVSFYRDRGRVHFQGAVSRNSGTGNVIFTLPPGYRPPDVLYFITYGANGTTAWVSVQPGGAVTHYDGDDAYIGLTNISFRAAQ